MPTITDWIMVVITGIYVVATIFICLFNYISAKATREQIAETKRQFEESNRAYITYELIYERRSVYGIRFTNYGNKVANHVQVQLKKEFIDSIMEINYLSWLNEQIYKEFVLGIGQSYDIYFGSNEYRKNPNKQPLEGKLIYKDDKKSYCEPFFIDVEHYATIFSVNSETEIFCDVIQKQTIELNGIKKELNQVLQYISKISRDKYEATNANDGSDDLNKL
ncbi:MAG: hypothetical protein VB119_06885 [Candidatus Metalachnospira sp.]|nr:hypothetical protein [Candidatus Metalachnospira sp.]